MRTSCATTVGGRSLLLLVGTVASACAEIAGIPEPPTPAPLPQFWLATHNDRLGDAILNTDDYRTGGLNAGFSGRRWLVAVDYSALTNRGTGGTVPSRSDELSYTLGYALVQQERDDSPVSTLLVIGAGGRTYGNLGGQNAQNRIHEALGYTSVHLPYDPEHGTVGVGYLYGRTLWAPLRDLPRPWPHAIGVQVQGSALRTTAHEQHDDVGIDLVALGSQGLGWVGARYHGDNGSFPTRTAQAVAEREAGWWVVTGLGRQPGLYVSAAVDPQSRAIDGSVGLSVQPNNARPTTSHLPVGEDLLFFPTTGAIGAQIRWQPDPDAGGVLDRNLLVDYRFGPVNGYDWTANRVDEDQLLIGYEPVYAPTIPGIPWLTSEVFAYGAGGVRIERVQVLSPAARYPQSTAAAAVLQGGAGLRLGLRLTNDRTRVINQVRLGVGYDGWLPLAQRHVTRGTDSGRYMKPGYDPMISLGFLVFW